MEEHTGTHDLLVPNPPNAFLGVESWGDAFADGQCSSEDATRLPLVGWVPDPDGDFNSMAMPMEWLQQFSVITPDVSSPPTATVVVGQQHAAPSPHWLQATASNASSIEVVGFESGLPQPIPGQWDASALATSTDGYVLQLVAAVTSHLGVTAAELTSAVPTAVHWHHDDWMHPGQYWPGSPNEDDSDHNPRKREAQAQRDGVMETWDEKRRRLTQTTLDTEIPLYLPTPELNSPNFAPDATHMHTTPAPRNSTTPLTSSTTPDTDNSHLTPASDTTSTTTPIPSPTATTPTTTSNGNSPKKPTRTGSISKPPRNRNRAAASRYRANKQAACAQLAAEEREARVRHESLLACAGQLREEVFRLKSELLRHAGAGCECPLIRGYLRSAAEETWVRRAGSISSSSSSGRLEAANAGEEGDGGSSGC